MHWLLVVLVVVLLVRTFELKLWGGFVACCAGCGTSCRTLELKQWVGFVACCVGRGAPCPRV